MLLNDKRRTQLARSLAKHLRDKHQIELKHTHANVAVASMLGFNEHSLAASISNNHQKCLCSVPGCKEQASYEVRLYDVYPYEDGEIFDEKDSSCPYLCGAHMTENEANAKGERKPRGYVKYTYTNQHGAQGFSVYRDLE